MSSSAIDLNECDNTTRSVSVESYPRIILPCPGNGTMRVEIFLNFRDKLEAETKSSGTVATDHSPSAQYRAEELSLQKRNGQHENPEHVSDESRTVNSRPMAAETMSYNGETTAQKHVPGPVYIGLGVELDAIRRKPQKKPGRLGRKLPEIAEYTQRLLKFKLENKQYQHRQKWNYEQGDLVRRSNIPTAEINIPHKQKEVDQQTLKLSTILSKPRTIFSRNQESKEKKSLEKDNDHKCFIIASRKSKSTGMCKPEKEVAVNKVNGVVFNKSSVSADHLEMGCEPMENNKIFDRTARGDISTKPRHNEGTGNRVCHSEHKQQSGNTRVAGGVVTLPEPRTETKNVHNVKDAELTPRGCSKLRPKGHETIDKMFHDVMEILLQREKHKMQWSSCTLETCGGHVTVAGNLTNRWPTELHPPSVNLPLNESNLDPSYFCHSARSNSNNCHNCNEDDHTENVITKTFFDLPSSSDESCCDSFSSNDDLISSTDKQSDQRGMTPSLQGGLLNSSGELTKNRIQRQRHTQPAMAADAYASDSNSSANEDERGSLEDGCNSKIVPSGVTTEEIHQDGFLARKCVETISSCLEHAPADAHTNDVTTPENIKQANDSSWNTEIYHFNKSQLVDCSRLASDDTEQNMKTQTGTENEDSQPAICKTQDTFDTVASPEWYKTFTQCDVKSDCGANSYMLLEGSPELLINCGKSRVQSENFRAKTENNFPKSEHILEPNSSVCACSSAASDRANQTAPLPSDLLVLEGDKDCLTPPASCLRKARTALSRVRSRSLSPAILSSKIRNVFARNSKGQKMAKNSSSGLDEITTSGQAIPHQQDCSITEPRGSSIDETSKLTATSKSFFKKRFKLLFNPFRNKGKSVANKEHKTKQVSDDKLSKTNRSKFRLQLTLRKRELDDKQVAFSGSLGRILCMEMARKVRFRDPEKFKGIPELLSSVTVVRTPVLESIAEVDSATEETARDTDTDKGNGSTAENNELSEDIIDGMVATCCANEAIAVGADGLIKVLEAAEMKTENMVKLSDEDSKKESEDLSQMDHMSSTFPMKTYSLVSTREVVHNEPRVIEVMAIISQEVNIRRYPSFSNLPGLTNEDVSIPLMEDSKSDMHIALKENICKESCATVRNLVQVVSPELHIIHSLQVKERFTASPSKDSSNWGIPRSRSLSRFAGEMDHKMLHSGNKQLSESDMTDSDTRGSYAPTLSAPVTVPGRCQEVEDVRLTRESKLQVKTPTTTKKHLRARTLSSISLKEFGLGYKHAGNSAVSLDTGNMLNVHCLVNGCELPDNSSSTGSSETIWQDCQWGVYTISRDYTKRVYKSQENLSRALGAGGQPIYYSKRMNWLRDPSGQDKRSLETFKRTDVPTMLCGCSVQDGRHVVAEDSTEIKLSAGKLCPECEFTHGSKSSLYTVRKTKSVEDVVGENRGNASCSDRINSNTKENSEGLHTHLDRSNSCLTDVETKDVVVEEEESIKSDTSVSTTTSKQDTVNDKTRLPKKVEMKGGAIRSTSLASKLKTRNLQVNASMSSAENFYRHKNPSKTRSSSLDISKPLLNHHSHADSAMEKATLNPRLHGSGNQLTITIVSAVFGPPGKDTSYGGRYLHDPVTNMRPNRTNNLMKPLPGNSPAGRTKTWSRSSKMVDHSPSRIQMTDLRKRRFKTEANHKFSTKENDANRKTNIAFTHSDDFSPVFDARQFEEFTASRSLFESNSVDVGVQTRPLQIDQGDVSERSSNSGTSPFEITGQSTSTSGSDIFQCEGCDHLSPAGKLRSRWSNQEPAKRYDFVARSRRHLQRCDEIIQRSQEVIRRSQEMASRSQRQMDYTAEKMNLSKSKACHNLL